MRVAIGGLSGLGAALTDPVAIGIASGLVLGKAVGISVATYLVARFTKARLDDELEWIDVIGLALLGGVGFTVSLLISELAFGAGSVRDDHATIGVLGGSLLAAALAAIVLRIRNQAYRRIWVRETADADDDGIPDIYQE